MDSDKLKGKIDNAMGRFRRRVGDYWNGDTVDEVKWTAQHNAAYKPERDTEFDRETMMYEERNSMVGEELDRVGQK